MLSGIKDFFGSEKGIWGFLVPMIGGTAMLIGGEISAEQWMEFTKWMTGFYVTGKSVAGAASKFADSRAVAATSRAELEAMKRVLAKNDIAIDKLISSMSNGKAEE